MFEARDLVKTFGSVVAVNKVSFTIDKPQMIGIIGRSGAGKSTLLRMINRLETATSGQIIADGVDVTALHGRSKRDWQRNCAMIFQQFNLVPRLDVLTNVILGRSNQLPLGRSILKIFTSQERFEALSHLHKFGLAEAALQRAETLSGGQQQRVAISRAMMQRPKMILADEPIASLDPMNARLVMDALKMIAEKENISVICNLHTLDTARNYCDRVIGMKDGQIVFDDQPNKLTDSMARSIYGAESGEAFEGTITSTSLGNTPMKEAV
ncbi:MAG: phosphonate ABC transporter ATP-binding protein [Proteobacteria bacterium]|nr:phosphonate ABC transporter ATP-binding protein [Pseudomonadota bacterium]